MAASPQVDARGIRIKTDILTSGYLRQDIENKLNISIPAEIKRVCFAFWLIVACDEWDTNYNYQHNIKFDGQKAEAIERMIVSIYGSDISDIIDKTKKYEWRLSLTFKPSDKYHGYPCIGIIHDKKKYLNKYLTSYNYDLDCIGCWLSTDGAFSNQFTETKLFDCIDPSKQDKVEIGMKIDLETKKIYYAIDEKEYVEAPYTLDKEKYRLVVTLTTSNILVELL